MIFVVLWVTKKLVTFYIGNNHLTNDEIEHFHLSILKLKYEDALLEYEKCSDSKLGRLIKNRELIILKRAYELINKTS